MPFGPADVIYVNAGATRPAVAWLDRLRDGGRLVLPLTTEKGFGTVELATMHLHGGVFLVTRRGGDLFADWISQVAIYPCRGMRAPEAEAALAVAFRAGDPKRVTRLYRHGNLPADRCWLRAPGWSLAYD